ncbi:hypothetical protein Lepto7375DRAFT_1460 [Leptolyngbya sp. PCC 7375]|nr:hypothetical protein Lepto7375DRAFT_1460 [Leptolyngbya sp. PCC 7375]
MTQSYSFQKTEDCLLLVYCPRDGNSWFLEKFRNEKSINLGQIYSVSLEDVYSADFYADAHEAPDGHPWANQTIQDALSQYDDEIWELSFIVGDRCGEYYRLKQKIFGTSNDIYFADDINLRHSHFSAYQKLSIPRRIDALLQQDLYIGGAHPDAISFPEYERLVRSFPTRREIFHYTNARITNVLRDFFDRVPDHFQRLDRYVTRHVTVRPATTPTAVAKLELIKYQSILDKLESMLAYEDAYTEAQWQNEIVEIVRLLFPKYLFAFREAPIFDDDRGTERSVDFLLVDALGNVDLLEIKKPRSQTIMSLSYYRNNHVPLRELAGTVMQLEKYIFLLSRSGRKGETRLQDLYANRLPNDFILQIKNPQGFALLGRHEGLSQEQSDDFEVVRRQYKNLIDIITYDDLIRRLQVSINEFARLAQT